MAIDFLVAILGNCPCHLPQVMLPQVLSFFHSSSFFHKRLILVLPFPFVKRVSMTWNPWFFFSSPSFLYIDKRANSPSTLYSTQTTTTTHWLFVSLILVFSFCSFCVFFFFLSKIKGKDLSKPSNHVTIYLCPVPRFSC